MSPVSGTSIPDPPEYGPPRHSAWMDIDWRAHRRFVEMDGRRVNVVELGDGDRAVVFIHGLAGSWQNWLENLPHFAAAGYRVIAFDLPGFGASDMPREKISILGYGRFVDELLDRLVLVSAAGLTVEYQRHEHVLGLLQFASRLLAAWGGFVAARSDAVARRARARRLLLRLVVASPELLPAPLISEQVRGSGTPGFVDALDALTDYPIRERLGRIGCPTLIVWGTEDHLVPVRDADEFERLIPGARSRGSRSCPPASPTRRSRAGRTRRHGARRRRSAAGSRASSATSPTARG